METSIETVTLAANNATGGLQKLGLGTLTLAGANTYTGLTSVQAGVLSVTGSIVGNVSVAGSATLMGSGTIGGNVVGASGSNVEAGASVGILTVNGNVNLSAGANMTWELGTLTDDAGGGVAGTDFDMMSILGNLTLGGTSKLTLDFDLLAEEDRPGYAAPDAFWASDHSWKIADVGVAGSTTGDFATLVNYSFAGVGTFDTRVAGNDVFLDFDSTYSPLPPIPGDTNNNRIVDETDAAVVAGNWGANVGTGGYASGDFNGDQLVNATDAAIQVANWGSHVAAESAAVPEPGIVALLLGAAAALTMIRRHK